ncbi:MAG: DNA translocase FtsK 4TM domain-containing protein [gamma proteobacterium symbiont of Bathyaustriella thionipta]|nr:DNA translocase FtsK 4TM domain-containing protein [gamma proteobacterium symbiont of Bathyaustriella thionipta]MCU7948490.1 DNA translocase FtsK 4TM domain-containing protein [gamma proteobacterium symbiont of Bathyaustriella thionipta]MCU7952714.1 DNA translocase FtsK 4TM domain-containing protein [gamma proteobacterium symbiont of Bathyaustriella thionipta]MCU7955490.1 DNA translocase FtsK 4TM domain-containing protein [gamma proteobacterium symbiont of Bathyaustriella thionipta]MCU796635
MPVNQPVEKKTLSAQVIRGIKESVFFLFIAISLYLFIALFTYSPNDPGWSHSISEVIDPSKLHNSGGKFGAWFSDLFLYLFGYLGFLFPTMLFYSGWLIYRGRNEQEVFHGGHITLRAIGFVLTIIAGAGLSSMHFTHPSVIFPSNAGGILGTVTSEQLQQLFSFIGATLFLLTLFLIGITLFTGLSWLWLMDTIGAMVINTNKHLLNRWYQWRDERARKKAEQESLEISPFKQSLSKSEEKRSLKEQKKIEKEALKKAANEKKLALKNTKSDSMFKIVPRFQSSHKSERVNKDKQTQLFSHDAIDGLPSLSLLDDAQPSTHVTSPESLAETSRLIEEKLADYNLKVEVVSVSQGPVITRFEIQLAAGIKVSQVTNLSKDLARAMRVVSIRVVEVIAGKSTVGIEIPNEHREIVYFSEVLGSKEFADSKAAIPLGLGHDISGQPVVADLAKMPHLLVAGTTGSGKSVGVNSMILSMVFQLSPDQLRLIMVDPKMLELSIYEDIPHLLASVVTDMKEAANALRWCVAEMERRYKLMAAMGVRNLAGFNKKIEAAIDAGAPILDPLFTPNPLTPDAEAPELESLPFIVIVIDEFADMMMIVGKKVEELIARLAQKARAAGLHLIIATQRPSVDVITGLIKANVPTRIGFQVSSKIDSRTILDQMGAENLLGHGDMLYLPPGMGYPLRVHGAFVSDNEVHAVVNDLKSRGKADYIDEILSGEGVSTGGLIPGDSDPESEMDPLYDQAVSIVTESRRASISGLQRRLKVGYNRAARMVEDMEAAGVVSAVQSNGQREVIAPPPI